MLSPASLLAAALISSVIYGVGFSWRVEGRARAWVKLAAMGCLILYAIAAGMPWLLVLALVCATVGDVLVVSGWNVPQERLLHTSLAAYMGCYLLQMFMFFMTGAQFDADFAITFALALSILVMGLVAFGKDMLSVSVVTIFYGLLVVLIVSTAYTLPDAFWRAKLGTALFFAAGLLYGIELFRIGAHDPKRYLVSPAIWFTYIAGHLLVLWAFSA
ncbi:hypothetical protein FHS89_002268 [Rubricella aquisinus]|uniref:Lysoplasmalogenase n=1 Tax=Rubricella aquisinus TaxID=2028108 RepID=A0A840WRE2_9RHOB|nr:lysoplasmalogenase family protein [Rubricella aquisinus]MBB5516242.1 hypothetical protein [Rubricella aquisinus]